MRGSTLSCSRAFLVMIAIKDAPRSLRYANAKNDSQTESWSSRIGSLCNLMSSKVRTGEANEQHNMVSGSDIVFALIL